MDFSDQLDDVFDLYPSGAQDFTSEQYAVTLDDTNNSTYKLCLELTLSLPQNNKDYKKLLLTEKIEVYRKLFEEFKLEYKAVSGSYEIEFHQNGNPHLHGHVEVRLHNNTFNYDVEDILKMFAKSLFLRLPKACYKQLASADVQPYIKRFRSPAVCINIKNILQKGWVDYIKKTH